MKFEFATATRIIFGPGALLEVGALAKGFGRRALVVTGRTHSRAETLLGLLKASGVDSTLFSVSGEPQVSTVQKGVFHGKRSECDLVISLGGGSALDAGKAIAGMMANPGDLLDYLEVVGQGRALTQPAVPFIAIPTTAGTGTEVTRNAVLASAEHRVKVSLRSPFLLPRVALIDPELTYALPPAITASTGLDALTQLIEPFVCTRANPMTDALCVEGMRRVARSLRAAFTRGSPQSTVPGGDTAAREDMCVASLFGGLALANAGLGAVHGFAAPIGGMFPAPHGAVCAILLPEVMAANLRALQQREPRSAVLARYEQVARLLTGVPNASAADGIEWVRTLVTDLRIPRLGTYGIGSQHIVELVDKAAVASSMKPNPIALSKNELADTLHRAL